MGVYRLAQRQALVRRAVTVENIGRVSCICSDKTGTITEGQLRLTHVVPVPGREENRLLSPEEKESWQAKIREFSASAHKVVAVASCVANASADISREPNSAFDFQGLLAFEDPVREGVLEAVKACQAAGIHPIMVTGDHPLTAHAVALEAGLGIPNPCVISGDEVESLVKAGHVGGSGCIRNSHPVGRIE